jgi:hypothetical protein
MDQLELAKEEATIEPYATAISSTASSALLPDDLAPLLPEQPVGENDVENPPTKCHSA